MIALQGAKAAGSSTGGEILVSFAPLAMVIVLAAAGIWWLRRRDARRGIQRDWRRNLRRGAAAYVVYLGLGAVIALVTYAFTSDLDDIGMAVGAYQWVVLIAALWQVARRVRRRGKT